MRAFSLVLLCLIILIPESLFSQCPDRDSVFNRIVFLRSTTSVKYPEQLKELLHFEGRVKQCLYYTDSVYTYLLLSIGVTYYRLADYNNAIQYTKKALGIIQLNLQNPAMNKAILSRYYYYLSIYYDSMKMPSQKYEAIDSCISNELKANSDYHYALIVLEDHVRNLYEKGDYNLCIERASLGDVLIHKFYQYSDSTNHVIFFVYYKANALRSLKKYNEEEQFLQSKKTELLKSKDRDYEGIIYNLFGNMYESRKDYNNAIIYFRKAFDFDKNTPAKDISAEVLNEIGQIYSEKLSQNRMALQYYRMALKHAKYKKLANGSVTDSVYIFGNIANVFVRMQVFDSAYYYFQMSFDRIKPGINETDLVSDIENYVHANTAEVVMKLVLDKANAYLQQYHYSNDQQALSKALFIYKTADKLLTKIKEAQSEIQSKLFWQMDTHILYEHAVEVSYLQNNFIDAFYFIEKSRAVLLNDQINKQNKISNAGLLEEAQIKKSILLLEREMDTSNMSSNKYIELQKEHIVKKQELERLGLAMKNHNPLFYQGSLDSSFITIQEVQKYLHQGDQELLEIFSGDSAIYSLYITRQQVYFNRISKGDFDSTAGTYISCLSNPALLNARYDHFIEAASHLYILIFQSKQSSSGRIIVSPDKQIFPFESLVTNGSAAQPHYFIQDHAVSYTYSAGYLLTSFFSDTSVSPVSFLGFAPVHYSAMFSLSALQGSDISLTRIGAYFSNVQNLVNAKATKNNFQQQFSNSKIIQLYTHSSDSSNRGEPVIYFADSVLYLSDLIPENKPLTRLIVLSACETGIGKLYQGEGVFSFNRGFASIGIPTSVTNLWAVDDRTTYQLTESFYKYLASGFPVDIALQKAKLEFIQKASKQNRLPYYWAAAIVVGKSGPLVPGENHVWREAGIMLFLIGIAFLVWQKWWKRKKVYTISG